jgi:hypothetical protein
MRGFEPLPFPPVTFNFSLLTSFVVSTVIKVENLSKRYRLGVINRDMLYKDLQSRWAYRSFI